MTMSMQRSSRLIKAIPFFYGWVILAVGTWGSVMMGPSQTFTFGLFIDSFERELQLSRATLFLLYGMATLGAAFLLPIVGKAIDRYGARRMMLAVTLGFGLSCLAMGSAQGMVTLLLALLALRFLGFGAMHLTSTTLITQWFIRKRGFVMGLAGQSLAISLFIYPPLGEFLIDQLACRGAWVAFGVLVWGIMLLLAFTLFLVQVMHVTWHGLLYGICMGLCSGSFRVIDAVLWAKYFGRQHLGSIRGVTTLGATGGTALGAFPLGLSKDFLGSYAPALDLFIVITLLMACIVWFTKRPQK